MTDQERLQNDDEALSALLDGELEADEAGKLRERLAREPALAERLERLARADSQLRDAYADVVEQPLPMPMLELLQGVRDDGDKILALRRRRRAPPRGFLIPAAVAASIALIVGIFVGELVDFRSGSTANPDLVAGAGRIEPGSRLHAVLQSVPSAETRELGQSLSATPRLTFRMENGGYCRQIDVTGAQGRTEALACRRRGEWRLELAAFIPEAADSTVYRPAAGPSTPVRAAVDSMIAGAPLGVDEERALIANNWSSH